MRRRTLLAGLAAAGSSAGCLASPGGSTRSPTPGGQPATPTGTTFDVTDRSCGNGANTAAVAFDDGTVAVDGVIGGRDTCDTAEGAAAMEGETLVVTVEVVQLPGTEPAACAECLTDIAYAFTAAFPAGGPARVRVVHRSADGESTVATADRP